MITQSEWNKIEKIVTKYIRCEGKDLTTGLLKKRKYLDKTDIISELTINLIEKMKDKTNKKLTTSFYKKTLKNEMLDWIKFNNREKRNEGYTTSYVEDPSNDEEMITGMFEIRSDDPTPEDVLMAKQLYDFAIEYFSEDDVEVLLGSTSRIDMAKKLGIPYDTYKRYLIRKIKDFKVEAKKGGYV